MSGRDKPLVWLNAEVKSPPFSHEARIEAGKLLRRLQRGDRLLMLHSRPMPSIGSRCHGLRILDSGKNWRIVYRIDGDAIAIAHVFSKTTHTTPLRIIRLSRQRLRRYDSTSDEG